MKNYTIRYSIMGKKYKSFINASSINEAKDCLLLRLNKQGCNIYLCEIIDITLTY